MRKLIFIIFIFSICCTAQQKQYNIIYDYHIGAKSNGVVSMNTYIKGYLNGNGKESLYEEDFITAQTSNSNTNSMNVKTKDNPIFYKQLLNNNVYYNDMVSFKFFDIYDSIGSFDWKIEEVNKIILGYNCQKATLFFRGRNYIAYFTTEIPFSDGPWKLSGLPGMILEVTSDNSLGQYNLTATKIQIESNDIKIVNPFENKDIITYDEFVRIYKSKYEATLAKISSYGGSGGMPKGYLELYITD